MIQKLRIALKKLQFFCRASNSKGHGTHSPFVYTFITEILNDERYFYAYEEIGFLKKELLRDKRKINYYGKETSIKELAKQSLPEKYNQLLFRIVAYFKPQNILEIGSSLGISTAYLAATNESIQVDGVETNELVAIISKQNFRELSLQNISIETSIDTLLIEAKRDKKTYDLIFINNTHEDLLDFCLRLSPMFNEDTIVVFKDINIDLEKNKSWTKIKHQATITISIELFGVSFIFFRKEQLKKQHFAIRF